MARTEKTRSFHSGQWSFFFYQKAGRRGS